MELLAPGGDIDSIKAAILAGADAVYCGLDKFNARNRAANITFEQLNGILRLAHKNKCQVFLTLNILIVESEIPALFGLLNRLINTSIDGIIIQDLGLFYLLNGYFKSFKIHASTQLTTHNQGQIHFLSKLNATRVNLSRELSIHEIKDLSATAHKNQLLTEVFVHGSYCLSFSGICYMSSVHGGNSGNRGRCSQPCRDRYETTSVGKDFPLNLKDNSAFTNLRELYEAGVDSLKIEGRIKKFHYVYTIVDAWRKQMDGFSNKNTVKTDTSALFKVFNRNFSNAFLKGTINRELFIDNSRDHSAIHLAETDGHTSQGNLEKAKGAVYDERTDIIAAVEAEINRISIAKAPLVIIVSGEAGIPLKISVKTPESEFTLHSEVNLITASAEDLTKEVLLSRLKAIDDTEYFIETLDLENLHPHVFLPFKELTSIKVRLLYILNDSREYREPVSIPVVRSNKNTMLKSTLSVLISSPEDLYLCNETAATIYFQIPESLNNRLPEYITLFAENKSMIPWFPSILIGDDYLAAVEFMVRVNPHCLVTNNTGIAYEAYKNGIPWIAGPYLNLVNSYSLLCLKENFNCSGAFISNELNRIQIKGIKKPEDFELYYSIYHPIVLMTSRQCLFHQVTGCVKDEIEDHCIPQCEKTATITNSKKATFYIKKQKGFYHNIYNQVNYLNTNIISEVPDTFAGFLIDLRPINTDTRLETDNSTLVMLFENLLSGTANAAAEILRVIHPTTNTQYRKGI